MVFGVGPYLGYKLVEGASPNDVVTLTRLWLSDELPREFGIKGFRNRFTFTQEEKPASNW